MRIGLQVWGSEGDIRPFMALSSGLNAAGHDVTLYGTAATNLNFTSYGKRLNIPIHQIGHIESMDNKVKQLMYKGFYDWNSIRTAKNLFRHLFDPLAQEMYIAALNLCNENEFLIGHFCMYPLKIAAFLTKRPYVSVCTAPTTPSRTFPPFGAPDISFLNPLWWKIGDAVTNQIMKPQADRIYRQAGLQTPESIMNEAFRSDLLNLVAVSPTLFPKPCDWPDNFNVCGFINLPEVDHRMELSDDLKNFIHSGEPPVYITFGSMMAFDPHPHKITKLMVQAVQIAGRRAIIQSDWDAIGNNIPENPNIFRVTSAPHHLIFPHCSVIVHHGGAGTTQSSVLAGRPSIVVAHVTDQPTWGNILANAGLAPKTLYRRTVSAKKLGHAIRSVIGNTDMLKKAEAAGTQMKQEDGLGNAVTLVESLIAKSSG